MSANPEEPRWQTYPGAAEPGPPGSSEPGTPAAPELGVPVVPQPGTTGTSGPGTPALPPAALPAVPRPGVPVRNPNVVPRPGYDPHDPLRLSPGGGGLKKEGVWTVPPYLSVHGDLGSVRLDFRRAQPTSQVIWIEISGGAGSIVIILPEGWAAQLDRVSAGIGSKKSSVPEEQVGGNPVLVLSGSMGLGSLKVRYPNRWDLRRLRRQLARERKQLR